MSLMMQIYTKFAEYEFFLLKKGRPYLKLMLKWYKYGYRGVKHYIPFLKLRKRKRVISDSNRIKEPDTASPAPRL